MKIDLAVIGQGVVSPAGVGLDALMHREPTAASIAPLAEPDDLWPVLRVPFSDPAFARWQREPRLRRASPITFFLVDAAAQALTAVDDATRANTGLIVAFSAGCLAYSRRFFEGIVTQGQKTASPALFPETVFNSPVSHVASVLGLNGAAYALVGDEAAWVAALKTAAVWLKMKRIGQVLVLGAEEFDPLVLDAYRSARWLRRGENANRFLASEGAAGLLVRHATPEDTRVMTHAHDGFIYRSKREASAAAEKLLNASDSVLPCYRSAQHNALASVEEKAVGKRGTVVDERPYLGEAFTASAAWRTLRALSQVDAEVPRLLLPIWGLNHQLASLELESKPSA
jgi:3-oxoacyl-(acyl-carrier-protein) synthase